MNAPAPPFYAGRYRSELGRRNQLGRLLWSVVWTVFFRPSPRPCFGWRRFLLRLFGADIAPTASVYPSARIYAPWQLTMEDRATLGDFVDCYCVDKVTLGHEVTVSQYSFLCTAGHDIDSPQRTLQTAPIVLEPGAWVFASAFVGPGVSIGRGAVVGACSVVIRDVEPFAVVAGNPARKIRERKRWD